MALTWTLGPPPKWYFADLTGKPLAGGSMLTLSSLNPFNTKAVFQDPAGQIPWPNPVTFDENGQQGPFFWQSDSNNPNDAYYIRFFDSNGIFQFDVNNYLPGAGGGGGGTTVLNLTNQITNSVMYRNIGASTNAPSTSIGQFLVVAPGAHEGFAQTLSNAGPDIVFVKNTNDALDSIRFQTFVRGTNPLAIFNGDTTPPQYFEYSCTSAGTETSKYIQFPITNNVDNLNSQTVTVKIYARANLGTNPQLVLYFWQFFGDGSNASTVTPFPIMTCNLTSSWQVFQATVTIPSTVGQSNGQCGNTGLFLRVGLPNAQVCQVDFVKPGVFVGSAAPSIDYINNDSINSVISSPRTGSITISSDVTIPLGYVPMNDGTIGSGNSGATTRANIDTFPLYNLLWNNVLNAWAPVTGGRGASAIADFSANKSIALTRSLGRVFALGNMAMGGPQSFTAAGSNNITITSSANWFTGTPVQVTGGSLPTGLSANTVYFVININSTTIQLASTIENAYASTPITIGNSGSGTVQAALGVYTGESLHTLTIPEMPAHNHNNAATPSGSLGSNPNGPFLAGYSSTVQNVTITNIAVQGGGLGHNNIQPTTYMNVFIKL